MGESGKETRDEIRKKLIGIERAVIGKYRENPKLIEEDFHIDTALPYELLPLSHFGDIMARDYGVIVIGFNKNEEKIVCKARIDAEYRLEFKNSLLFALGREEVSYIIHDNPIYKNCDPLYNRRLKEVYDVFLKEAITTFLLRLIKGKQI